MKGLFLLVWFSTISFVLPASDLVLGSLFQDHMVMQQETTAPVWGRAAPSAMVEVTLHSSMGPQVYNGKADSDGKWSIEMQGA